MPIIPLLRPRVPIANAPAAVLDTQRRPNVDNRAVQQAVGELAKSSKMPLVDARAAAAPYEALGAVGEAVMKAGGVIEAAALARRRAESTIQVSRADQMMADIAAEQEKFQESTPDPRKWTANFETLRNKAKTEVLKQEGLHQGAREDILVRLDNWQRTTARNVDLNRSKKTNALARDASLTYVETSFVNREYDAARTGLKTAIRDGYAWEHEMPALEARIERSKKQDESEARQNEYRTKVEAFSTSQNLAVAMAGNVGENEALEALERGEMGKHEPADKEKLRNAIQSVSADRRANALATLAEGIAAGTITTDAAIDAASMAHTSPLIKAKAKELLRGFRQDKVSQEIESNGIRNAVELRQKVKDYDSATDPTGEKFFRLNLEITSRVDPENTGEIAGPLYQKYSGALAPKRQVRPEIQQNVSKSLDVLFDPETGAVPWRTKTTNPRTGETITTEDSKAQQRAIDAQTTIEMKMADWFKQNPDDAQSLPKVKAKLQEYLPEGTRSAALDSLQSLLAPPPARTDPPDLGAQGARGVAGPEFTPAPGSSRVTSYAYQNDETPDSNSSAGIGAFVPKEEQAKIKRGEPSPYKLRAGDFAVSRDVEKEMRKAGIQPGDEITVQLDDGSTETGRWMDRTAEDWPIGSGKAVTGRFDFYQGGQSAKHPKEAAKVTGFRRAAITNE